MIYFNDNNERISKPIEMWEVAEIADISEEEFSDEYGGDFEKLNADLYEFSFSYTPKYPLPQYD